MLLWRILFLPCNFLCKQLLILRFIDALHTGVSMFPNGPVRAILESLIEYGLLADVSKAIHCGSYCSVSEWKCTVWDRICKVQKDKCMAHLMTYRKLTLYFRIYSNHIWPWWHYASQYPQHTRECKTLLRLIAGEHCLSSNFIPDKSKTYKSKMCTLCQMYVTEDILHFLFECTHSVPSLNQFWDSIKIIAPLSLAVEMQKMSPSKLTTFCMSGFHCRYVPEWSEIYHVVCKYIHDLYIKRQATSHIPV